MKSFYILIIALLGFFLMPISAIACEQHSETKSHHKEITTKVINDDCCSSESHLDKNVTSEKHSCCEKNNHSNKNGDNSCSGKCKNPKCSCPSTIIPFISSNDLDFRIKNVSFYYKNQKIALSETFLSSGFYSIWLIPKIS
ncbi:MAG: hypothetical protein ACI7YS_07210 [Flavobacterium sp.]